MIIFCYVMSSLINQGDFIFFIPLKSLAFYIKMASLQYLITAFFSSFVAFIKAIGYKFNNCRLIFYKDQGKHILLVRKMNRPLYWVVLTVQLALQMKILTSIDPVLQLSPYFQSFPVSIKSDLSTYIDGSNPITKEITFTKIFTQIPKLAYGIKNYRSTDRIGIQKYSVITTSLTSTSFTVFTELISYTKVRILDIFYFAVDKSCPFHINAFHEVDANYQAGPLVNISSSGTGTRLYRNVINYANLAGTIGSSFNSFGPELAKNKIMLYMTGFHEDIATSLDTVPLLYTISLQILSVTEFEIIVTIQPYFFIELIKLSIIIVDIADLQKTNQATIVAFQINLLVSSDQYIPVPQMFMQNGMFGFKDFKAESINCGIELNFQLDPSNDRIIFNQSIPPPQSNATCGVETLNATIFYVISYECQDPGYPYLNTTSLTCEQIICGDGKWMMPFQACEDANLNDNDGCSNICTVETDFTCLTTDQLPNGLSLCKYTQNISFTLKQIINYQAQQSLKFYFTLKPQNYGLWNQSTIQALVNSIQISLEEDPSNSVIPSSDITVKFDPNQPNQVQLIILYNNRSLDQSFLNFTITPSNTLNPSISHLPPIEQSIFVNFSSNVINISSNQDFGSVNQVVEKLSQTIGALSLILLMFGFFVPVGRLIIVETLAVVQISFFSILQLGKIPSSFISLKFLLLSTGFSEINKISTPPNTKDQVYILMGLSNTIIANLNIGILLFGLPFLIGGVGMIVTKIMKSSQQKSQKIDQTTLESTQRQVLCKQDDQKKLSIQKKEGKVAFITHLFKRILHQSTLYGLLVCGYLIFVSIFHSLEEKDTVNIILVILICIFWVFYCIFIFRGIEHDICLKKLSEKNGLSSSELKHSKIWTEFGDFREIHQQISGISKKENQTMQKLYILFMTQRIVTSTLIVFVSKLFVYTPLLLITIFIILFVVLNVSYQFYQKKVDDGKKKPMFSYLLNNYVLRQSINFVTILGIEVLFLVFQILFYSEGEESVLKTNEMTTQVLPCMTLAMLLVNIIVNVVFLILELKESQIITKAKIIISILFQGQQATYQQSAKTQKQDSPEKQMQITEKVSQQIKQSSHKTESPQEKQINAQLNNYTQMLVESYGFNSTKHKITQTQRKRIIDHKLVSEKSINRTDIRDNEIKWKFQPKQQKIKVLYGNPIYDQI